MPKYKVILTRDITESTVIEVEADNDEQATDLAYDRLAEGDTEWHTDDVPATGEVFVSGIFV